MILRIVSFIYQLKPFIFFSFRCIVDSTTQTELSPSPHKQRFSVAAFEFIGKFPFVYLHCSVVVCKADDPNSRCAQGCIQGSKRGQPMIGSSSQNSDSTQAQSDIKSDKRKSPIRHTRAVYKNPAKKEKEHKYLLSKGPVSLIEDEPEVVRNDEPDVEQSNDEKPDGLELEKIEKDKSDSDAKASVGK